MVFYYTLIFSFFSNILLIFRTYFLKTNLSFITNSSILNQGDLKWLLIAILILSYVLLIVNFFEIKSRLTNKIIEINNKEFIRNKEYQTYLLFLGILNPITEINLELFFVRPKSLLFSNLVIGIIILILYLISTKFSFVFLYIKNIFITIYIIYFILICKNIIINPLDIIPVISFIIIFFFSFTILKPIKLYWTFILFILLFIVSIYIFDLVPAKTFIILLNFSILIFIINYISHVTSLNIRDKFRFTNEIVNNGNSLIMATNKKGEVQFCSETIKSILGYNVDEVIGMGFWKVTEDPEFIGEEFHNNTIVERTFTRKLKCKNGEYKYIQWNDKRFSDDLIIGIGRDVTIEIKTQKFYENLVESANDIIFELNKYGDYLFINKNSEKITGYLLEELFKSKFTNLIRKDYTERVVEFYSNTTTEMIDFPMLEFPIIKKNGDEIWISQKVSINRDEQKKIKGYSVIARDVSFFKSIDKERTERQVKNQKYSAALKGFTAKSYSNNESLENKLRTILEITSKTIEVDRASYWKYYPDKFTCLQLYDLNSNKFKKDNELTKEQCPNYFLTVDNKIQIVASDVYTNESTKELCDDYFPKNNIISLLDTPVFIDGELNGIICFETTKKTRQWDNEDINFARSVSDIIAIAFESKMRLDIERKLTYKSELLAAMTLCTEKFLNSKDINEIFSDVLIIMGKATKSHRAYYYEKDISSNRISQKYRWVINNVKLTENNVKLQNLPFDYFEELIHPLLDNKIYEANVSKIKNESLRKKLQNVDVMSLILFPIFVKNKFHGFLGFDDTQEQRTWSEDEVNILQTLAKNIASSIDRIASETAIYESEEKFRLLANNIPGVVYLSENDEKFTKIYVNDQIEILTGYTKEEFLEAKIIYIDLLYFEDREKIIAESSKSLAKSQSFHLTYRIVKKTGEIIWVEEFGDAILKDDKIAYIEGIILDITERKDGEAAIKGREYAEAASRAKSEFLANMSHEIRTPLNGIIGFTDLLMKTKLEEIQQKHMVTVNQSAHTLLGIINDILDFSKIEAGKLELHIEKHNIKEILNEIIDLISYESNQKNIKLELNIDPEIPAFFWIDIVRLKQVLINLLANAVKFTEKGFIRLDLSVIEKITSSRTLIRFAVIDSGIGIQEKNKIKIFKAFSQGDTSTTKKFGGTGLGITISNQLLALMESRLQLESKIGFGSTFYFDLNLKTSQEKNSNKIQLDSLTFSDQNFKFKCNENQKNLKIMIVEDNKINMLLLKTILKNILPDAIIYEAINGEEAIKQFNNVPPNIIFMDIQMPIMNGYVAAIEIRKLKLGSTIPIIAITAGTEMEVKDKCFEVGMNDYISKPIIKNTIEKIITKWII